MKRIFPGLFFAAGTLLGQRAGHQELTTTDIQRMLAARFLRTSLP